MSRDIFIIAGEPSGDALAARLMAVMKTDARFTGIGGDLMKREGLESLLPMEEICVMGLAEVVTQLPRLIRLIAGVVEEIEKRDPAAVITVDLPDFNFEVVRRLKKRGLYKGKIIHYVAPSVWAWRPGRAKKVARFLDGLICLFPFEPDYFTRHGLKAVFAGHPMIETSTDTADGQRFRQQLEIPPEARVVGLFLGSRVSEVKTLGPVLVVAAKILGERYPDLHLVIPTLPHLEFEVLQLIRDLKFPAFVITEEAAKPDSFAACNAAVAVSGTVALELAYAGVPHVIAYKMHPLSWLLVKLLVKVKYAHLANILLNEPAVPEYLQWSCKPELIAENMVRLLNDEKERAAQLQKFTKLRAALGAGSPQKPSERAADFILSSL